MELLFKPLLHVIEFKLLTNGGIHRKKTSLEESLAESHAYNLIQDSGETLGDREKFCQESRQKSHRESRRESRLDSWWDSRQDSWRDFWRSPSVSPRVSDWIICTTLCKTRSETRFFTRAMNVHYPFVGITDSTKIAQILHGFFKNVVCKICTWEFLGPLNPNFI